MLRVNVATRPFYNERGVHLGLALAGVLLLAVTAINAAAWLSLSARESALTAQTSEQEARARQLRDEALQLRASINRDELERVLASAREANALIDARTFSWTELFNYLEATLPEDVMLTGVRPLVQSGTVTLTLGVVGRDVEAIDAFMTQLEDTGAFRDVLSRDEAAREDGGYEATLVGAYLPTPTPPVAPAAGRGTE
jgi:hypothetical protein